MPRVSGTSLSGLVAKLSCPVRTSISPSMSVSTTVKCSGPGTPVTD
ncbi:MAG TPA: hypothetical protein VJX66_18615 [Amycolatopsis sp.]|nr:hypothetical protein [Amycolatopsis sp.]